MVLAQKQTHWSMDRMESPELNPHNYGQLIYDKVGNNIQWGESLFSSAGKTE